MKVSVLISVCGKDHPGYLREALQGLVNQTRPAEEVVLVEDGLLPSAFGETIERFRQTLNVVSVKLPENVWLAGALNAGLTRMRSGIGL